MMETKILKKALDVYGVTEQDLIGQLSGGTYNAVYEFEQDGNRFVIRIGELEFDVETTNGMIEWLRYLRLHRAAVPELVNSIHNHPVEYLPVEDRTYSVDVSHKIPGENARATVLQYQNLSWAKTFGQAVGRIHQLATTNPPESVLQVRPRWDQIGNDFIPPMKLSVEETIIAERRAAILNQIYELPTTPDVYGLIHLDLHLGNILVHADAPAITILDFDDVALGWFVMDLVAPITDIVVSHPGQQKDEIINTYLAEAIAGYQLEREFSLANQAHIPLFLSLLEIGFYTRFHKNEVLQQENGWVKTFMTDRKERIEAGIPFVNIDIG
jgi:Ser/Thr protein kinase RdoA (MazF antagonist)